MSGDDNRFRELFTSLKTLCKEDKEYIDEIIENVIFILINKKSRLYGEYDEDKVNEYTNYVKGMLIDLYNDYVERTDSVNDIRDDIEYIGAGFTFVSFRVGDNVIKFGKCDYPNYPRTLKSKYQVPAYVRESYEVGEKMFFRVEVSPFVDVNNISYEDCYETYKNVRGLGYIWNDPKEENLGRIISVGGCTINGKRYEPEFEYNEGDLVILDLDDIAYVGEVTSDMVLDEISMTSYNPNVYRFETRYMDEKDASKRFK